MVRLTDRARNDLNVLKGRKALTKQTIKQTLSKIGSTIKVNIELPVATRHRRDMTEKLLKAT